MQTDLSKLLTRLGTLFTCLLEWLLSQWASWLAEQLLLIGGYLMRPIEKLILHCSDTPDDRDIGVKELRSQHISQGWLDVGYHEIIRRDGTLEPGRPLVRIGAHCKGHNLYSIGICLVGRDKFTPEQMKTLVARCRHYMTLYGLKPDQVFGHYELDNKGKTCPNFDTSKFRIELGA